jgi:Phage integrase, N-terminal SAM-like domain
MPTTLRTVADGYLRAKSPSRGTRGEYRTTLRKWDEWASGPPIEQLRRKDIREFLDWVYDRAVADKGDNPGRTANKAREQLRAILSWAWEQEIIETPPRFPAPKDQRDVAGRHYLNKAEINALYFATHEMERPRGWNAPHPIGRYWRSALVVFFNYGLDTGTVWQSTPDHEPILWRHVVWDRHSPDRETKEQSRWG